MTVEKVVDSDREVVVDGMRFPALEGKAIAEVKAYESGHLPVVRKFKGEGWVSKILENGYAFVMSALERKTGCQSLPPGTCVEHVPAIIPGSAPYALPSPTNIFSLQLSSPLLYISVVFLFL